MTEKITSASNNQIKEAAKLTQKKYREKFGLFLVEGIKPIIQAAKSGFDVQKVFVSANKAKKYEFLKNLIPVEETVLKKISTTESAPEIAAVIKKKNYSLDIFKKMKKLILLENIKDGGNLGTILRSAAAFGIEGVLLAGDTVDIYNPKVIRSSVGTMFMMPNISVGISEIKKNFPKHKLFVTTLRESKTNTPDKADNNSSYIIAFGSEAQGVTEELAELADEYLKIQHNEAVESLNLSVAASIIMYELNKNS